MTETCRFCATELKHTFTDLGMSPLSNAYLSAQNLNTMEPFYPLHVSVCHQCFLVQLPLMEKPETIFNDYAYFSSFSDSWLEHCKAYCDMATARFELTSQSQVVEIASNDGYLLQYFQQHQIPVLGIEPAANVAQAAIEKGIPTRVTFFGTEAAQALKDEGIQPNLLLGNNVLAHVPELNDFVKGLKILLKESGVITIEVPHLLQLMENNQFDTIYHEHFSYFSLRTLIEVFAAHQLKLFDVDELPTHGGSLRIYAGHVENANLTVSENVKNVLEKERLAGLEEIATYESFGERNQALKRELLRFLIDAKEAGKTVVGYGAPAKGNTLLNYAGVRSDLLAFTVDRSPHKQGRFLPGTHIPIYAPSEIDKVKPDFVLILPWNIQDEIMAEFSYIQNWGGQFVVPIPHLRIVTPKTVREEVLS